ncbi:MAG: sigma-70 family RNA polymerase sigma factor [Metasolibacillus sp.]|uniref:Sigma-70 family RNA polymerase sigma factor n=1 Tax=Lysinibacillus louembei TaxID=1470088 RepID=A0ABZ0RR68_9BACI|nr:MULTISPECIES: sigma-70 family RNA polymerase sigma factor [Bacillales]MCT6940764.1 sigma-70 family RNA polymerase sigma factor [Metasolibacillus sp.]WPK10722.1 sigma-70 family RNA polymerase sigma factor [Lysinibacillus louembei]
MLTIHDLKEIMNLYTESLIRLAYYYVKDCQAAEDIVQEVFIKMYHHQDKYEERGELKAFLYKMTANKSKDYLKSWSYRKVQLQNKIFPFDSKIDLDELVRKEEETIVGEAILELPLKQREVLIYFYFNEMNIKDIASILTIPESTVKTRLRRGKELLKNKLKDIQWEVLLNE